MLVYWCDCRILCGIISPPEQAEGQRGVRGTDGTEIGKDEPKRPVTTCAHETVFREGLAVKCEKEPQRSHVILNTLSGT